MKIDDYRYFPVGVGTIDLPSEIDNQTDNLWSRKSDFETQVEYCYQSSDATVRDYIKITQIREDLTIIVKLMQQIVNADDPKAKIAEIIADLQQPPVRWAYLLPLSNEADIRCNDFIVKNCGDWIYREWEKWT
jgi:hypothetical protein